MISISFQDPYCSHAFALSIHPLVSMSILVLFGRSRSLLQFPSSPRLSRSLHPTIRRIPHSFIAPTLSIPSVPYGNGKKHQHLLFPSRLPHVSAVLMAQFPATSNVRCHTGWIDASLAPYRSHSQLCCTAPTASAPVGRRSGGPSTQHCGYAPRRRCHSKSGSGRGGFPSLWPEFRQSAAPFRFRLSFMLYETHTSCITATAAPPPESQTTYLHPHCHHTHSFHLSPLLLPHTISPDPRTPDSPFTIPTDLLNHSARRTS